jgi:NitT/TauT family transport system permease protein
MGLGDIPTIMAVALLLTLIAVTCNSLMLMLDKKLQHR